ncbi:MAG: flavin reductase [Bacillota bacterium]|nr:flavin reductase [Bacillota bacterium]
MSFQEISTKELMMNPFDKISNEWMLISAQKEGKMNTMTASWGMVGHLWGKDVVQVFIRPQRYTKEFVDNSDTFTISFFNGDYKKELGYLGSKSGRNEDKVASVNFHPTIVGEAATFEEASLAIVCKKVYIDEIKEEKFLDQEKIDKWYPQKDYHTCYIGEIVNVYTNK